MIITLDLPHIAKIRHQSGWTAPNSDNIAEKLMLTHEELSEAYRMLRKGHAINARFTSASIFYLCRHRRTTCAECDHSPDGWRRVELAKPEGFGVEVADAIMRLGDICYSTGIDLQACLIDKQRFNAQRPYKHGGRKF